LTDLNTTVGLEGTPAAQRVSRWANGFHQYDVGHLDLCDDIDSSITAESHGRIRVAGAAYRGLGIPACIRQGRHAAGLILAGS
jgi:oxygen-dependent protoporphyrinogen oxidase